MTVDPIRLNHPTSFYPIDSGEYNPDPFIIKRNQEKYYRDTLAPQMVQISIPVKIESPTFAFELNGVRPRLEAPAFEAKKFQNFGSNNNNHLIHQVEKKEMSSDTEEDLRESEYRLTSAIFDCYLKQKTLTEEQSLVIFDGIKKRQEQSKLLGQEYFSQMDELIQRSKTSESLTWISWALTGGVIAGGFASIAITWGVSIPAVFASWISIGNAIAGMAAGGMKVTQGVYSYVTDLMQGAMKELEYLRQNQDQKINISMEEMKQSMEIVSGILQQIIEILNNQYQASLMR